MNEQVAQEKLETILNHLGVSFDELKKEERDGGVVFHISSSEGDLLIGNKGEHLTALSHVFKKILEQEAKTPVINISLDINGYRASVRDRVRNTASMLAERAIMFKHEVEMEPMGSFERRVVHSMFQDHPNIKTESSGEGRGRRVVIYFVENKKPEEANSSEI